ncbi:MAG: bifunctional metallophosphatase/5'-nucleotidase [Rikenellaceae bacterium]|nr:bifunctional metallophosphatase/5'-nucleotidase [Rikenellaceae bacterium]
MKRTVLLLFAAGVLAACGGGGMRRVIIVSTNDTHGAIDMFARLATLTDSLRRGEDPVILLHAGDWSTGNPYADLYPKRGYPNIALMDSLHYDLATLGNHEFDNGTDTLTARLNDATFPVVVANMQSNGSLPELKPYRFIDAGGLRFCFLGLITVTDSGHPDGFDYNFGRTTFSDPIETAKKYACLRDSCDILVALTHIGYEQDSILAVSTPEFGLVIGGHSHTVVPDGRWIGGGLSNSILSNSGLSTSGCSSDGLSGGGTLITQTGSKLRYAGVTTLTVNDEGQVVNIENRLVDLSELAPEPRIAAMVEQFKSEGQFGETVGEATQYLSKNALCNLFVDALRTGTRADVALVNLGGVRLDHLDQGCITRGDVYSLEPFGNRAVLVEMTTAQIEEMIRNKFNSTGKESHAIDLWPSGMSYRVALDDNGEMRRAWMSHGTGLPDAGGRFLVAMSDFVFANYRFSYSGPARQGEPITALLEKYIRGHSPISPSSKVMAQIDR